MTRALIVVRAGPNSLHPDWLGEGREAWDLFVCPYGETSFPADPARGVHLGEVIPGAKWTGLRRLLEGWGGWRDYDYVMLADDDLLAPASVWTRFFETIRAEGALLAQPALTADSYVSHLITLQNPRFSMRRTSFVEIMAPCFRVDVLDRLLPSFAATTTGWGWGLDYVWPKLLDDQGLFIVDDAPIRHTRPIGTAVQGETRRLAHAEFAGMLQRYGAARRRRTLAGLTRDGRWLEARDAEFLRLYLDGYWPRLQGQDDLFAEVFEQQTGFALTRKSALT